MNQRLEEHAADQRRATAFSNVNSLWGAVTAAVLARLGMQCVVVAPGSRSTPLTYAFSCEPGIRAVSILDERSAAFFALGVAKRTRNPVAVVSTSGTAAANFLPAVVEARQCGVGMLFLTCDRPPEGRHCHSGQTIEQVHLFGAYPVFQAELSLPSSELQRLRYLRQTLRHGWFRATQPDGGPVHFNVPCREPLEPFTGPAVHGLPRDFSIDRFVGEAARAIDVRSRIRRSFSIVGNDSMDDGLLSIANGVIIAGPCHPIQPGRYAQAVGHISQTLKWPVLSDCLNPLRNQRSEVLQLIAHYDLILRNATVAKKLLPRVVFSLGPLPTSKILRNWLQKHEIPTWIVNQRVENFDPVHSSTTHLRLSLEEFSETLQRRPRKRTRYISRWLKADALAARLITRRMRDCPFMFEGKIAWMLSRSLPPKTPIFIANSMPVRDAEFFWQLNDREYLPYSNRGANGIDGTLSTALGVAAQNRSAVLLTGDLALLHDTNGFLLWRHMGVGHLTIILINNRGGGIFESLPIADLDPPFERYFATPQEVVFEDLAKAYGVAYERVESFDRLARRVSRLPRSGVRLLEIRTDRKVDMRWRRRLLRDLSDEISI